MFVLCRVVACSLLVSYSGQKKKKKKTEEEEKKRAGMRLGRRGLMVGEVMKKAMLQAGQNVRVK